MHCSTVEDVVTGAALVHTTVFIQHSFPFLQSPLQMPSTPYERIFLNNEKWVEGLTRDDPAYFEKLASVQEPDYLYIGCSDSRVPPNEIMGVAPGDLLVHRNIGNVVANTDLNIGAVIEFGVTHLGVKRIIVCGHYGCGGVQFAMKSQDLGLLNPWLRNIRDVYRLHQDELDAIADQEQRYKRLVELNVIEQCINVTKTAAVQRSYLDNGYPVVYGWVFDLKTGLLRDLDIDFPARLRDIQRIYNLMDDERPLQPSRKV